MEHTPPLLEQPPIGHLMRQGVLEGPLFFSLPLCLICTSYSLPTRLSDYIAFLLPWAHGHQLKAIGTSSRRSLPTACRPVGTLFWQARSRCQRLSRLLLMSGLILGCWLMPCCYRPCISYLSTAKCDWPLTGREADQHLLVVSLVVGRRAVPMYWRAYAASVLRTNDATTGGHPPAVGRVAQAVGTPRHRPADRGFAAWPCLPYSASWASRSSSG